QYTDIEKIREILRTKKLSPPFVIKPSNLGSTIGVTILHNQDGLKEAIDEAFSYSHKILIEKFIPGKEITVGILGGKEPFAVPTIEIIPRGEYYTYETKYLPGMSEHIIPARVDESVNFKARELGLKAHRALGCYGMSRVDMIARDDGNLFVLEVNTLPGMTQTSLLPEAAAKMGIDFCQFVKLQVEWALEREKAKSLIKREGPGLLGEEPVTAGTDIEDNTGT
ncbi:MAG: ATP-grasp domain-containing protein, partial [Candidatus Eremiobacteraeota bacterium]|nr:ATP-grasp domain-containing protein [Candidatus Eremiobacteraeota bacterium]